MRISELFRPKWKHPDEKIRKAAVEKLTSQEKLAEVAKNDQERSIRHIAAAKLTDQRSLAAIALNDPDRHMRYIAARSLHDQKVLIDLLNKEKDDMIREEAFRNISDENVRKELVEADNTLKAIHQKYCVHKYLVTGQDLDMVDLTDEYTLRCTRCGYQVKTHYPKQYM
jgi:hypothetical protein